jgi:hypothetical protein
MSRAPGRCLSVCTLALAAAMLAGCQVEGSVGGGAGGPDSFRSASLDAVIGSSGACLSAGNADPRSIHLGISPCDLVRVLGRPKDVVVSELPDGRRRVSMFYPGTGGTTRSYTFVADRLISTPPGSLKETYAGRQ